MLENVSYYYVRGLYYAEIGKSVSKADKLPLLFQRKDLSGIEGVPSLIFLQSHCYPAPK